MRRLPFVLPILILGGVAVFAAINLNSGRDPHVLPSALIGKPLPEFALGAVEDGKPGLTRADLDGQVAVVNFFASWCIPCRAEHPLLGDLVKVNGVSLYGIAYKDKRADTAKYLAELGDPYGRAVADETGMTGIDFGITGVPETFVVDKTGIIRYRLPQPLDPGRIKDELIPLLQELTK
jgi:DsbE subfamily thiol:disulfide oxidoreductase